MEQPLGGIGGWVIEVVQAFGYGGLVALIALETLFPPIPSELILPLAGFLTGQGRLAFPLAVAASTAGSVIGALVFYWLGHALGERRIRDLVKRYGRWALMEEADLDKAQGWFDRYGGVSVVVGRVIPAVRSYVSIPAGVARMPLPTFVLLTALGSAAWNALLIGAGWWLGERWEQVGPVVSVFGWAVPIVLAVLIGHFAWTRLSRR